MKKIFAIALAVVMVLSIASVASAFTWSKPADSTTADNFGYSIDVIKFTRSTGELGSSYFKADDAATAVNGADVYYAIKLVKNSPSSTVEKYAKVDVTFTAIEGGVSQKGIDVSGGGNGVYYYGTINGVSHFYSIENFVSNNLGMNATAETPVFAARCLDTATAKVEAKVYSERPLDGSWFEVGSYEVAVNDRIIAFRLADTDKMVATFTRNADDLVVGVTYGDAGDTETMKLYEWLNNGSATDFRKAVENKEVYMTNANLRAAFGFSYSQSDSATWKANSTPIILDPTVSIPKTGDNASVIGFAMIMVAVVAAAVAVRKVNA